MQLRTYAGQSRQINDGRKSGFLPNARQNIEGPEPPRIGHKENGVTAEEGDEVVDNAAVW